MENSSFVHLWGGCIKPAVDKVLASVDKKLIKDYKVNADLSDTKCKILFGAYRIARDNMKTHLFNVGDGKKRIDIHKVVACFVYALLRINLVHCDTQRREADGKVPTQISSLKYAITVSAAMYILHSLMLSNAMLNNDNKLVSKLQDGLRAPNVNKGNDGYFVSLSKALALTHYFNGVARFDTLAYANIFFWLDKYNTTLLLCE